MNTAMRIAAQAAGVNSNVALSARRAGTMFRGLSSASVAPAAMPAPAQAIR